MRRRKLTTEQKQAAADRLAAARAKKGEPKYSQYDQTVVNLPDDHKLSFKKVRQWIKANKDKLPMLCLLYTSPSPRDRQKSRMPSSA